MTNHEKIIELNKIWYDVICGDYHKDRDCHFRISTHYFYGDQVEWEVEHFGYILVNEIRSVEEFATLHEAEVWLIHNVLKFGILREITFFLEHYGDPQWDQHTKYNKEELEGIVKKVLEIAPD
jgi:hypothetical protein